MSEYLIHFTDALQAIVGEIGFSDVTFESVEAGTKNFELVASVGITGDLRGFMMLRSKMESAKNFVDRMLLNMGIEGEEEEGFGQFHKEAIGEIVNQISGRSTMMLADHDIDCNITPPTIIAGSNVYTDISACESSLALKIQGTFGNIELFIGIKSSDLKINS